MDVSRITRGLIELQRERLKVSAVVFHALETSQPLDRGARSHPSISPIDEDLEVMGDLSRLTQVVANILHNAAKFTPKGGRHRAARRTRRRRGRRSGSRTTARASPAEALPQVFDLFSHTDRRLDRASTGLGVGLALVRRLVDMHGGHVAARSEGPGRGTELDRASAAARAGAAADAARVEPSGNADGTPSRRILVVDDNATPPTRSRCSCACPGTKPSPRSTAWRRSAAPAEFRPDIVLLDIGMPRLDGYGTARAMRAEPWGRDLTLVALTGWGQPKDRDRTVEAGFNAHLVKPVATEKLMQIIRTQPSRT